MLKMDIIHHLLVIFRYFYGRVKLFPVGGTNARQFWMVMHRFWPDGHPQLTIAIRDQPKLKAGKNKIPWWWRNYFCCAFLGLRTDALPTPVTLVYSRAFKPFDFKAICVKSRFCSCRNSVYIPRLNARSVVDVFFFVRLPPVSHLLTLALFYTHIQLNSCLVFWYWYSFLFRAVELPPLIGRGLFY